MLKFFRVAALGIANSKGSFATKERKTVPVRLDERLQSLNFINSVLLRDLHIINPFSKDGLRLHTKSAPLIVNSFIRNLYLAVLKRFRHNITVRKGLGRQKDTYNLVLSVCTYVP